MANLKIDGWQLRDNFWTKDGFYLCPYATPQGPKIELQFGGDDYVQVTLDLLNELPIDHGYEVVRKDENKAF